MPFRFGLRSALVVAFVFCLVLGWIGRGFYRVRQDDAAIEAILQAGGTMWLAHGSPANPQALPSPSEMPVGRRFANDLKLAVGWSNRPEIATVDLRVTELGDPAAPQAIAALERFPEVEKVSLSGGGFDDASIQALGSLPNLNSLTLTSTAVTADGLVAIPGPERFHSFACDGFSVRNLLEGVRTLTELRSICVGHTGVTKEEIEAIASLPKLETLSLRLTRPGRNSVSIAQTYTVLKPPRGTSAIDGLAESESLRALSVSESHSLSEAELFALASPPNLEELSVSSLAHSGLFLIKPGPRLRVLMLPDFLPDKTAQDFSAEHPECEVQLPNAYRWPIAYRAGQQVEPPPSSAAFRLLPADRAEAVRERTEKKIGGSMQRP